MNNKLASVLKILKRISIEILKIFFRLLLLSIFIQIFFNPWHVSIYTPQIQLARDTVRLEDYDSIKLNLEKVDYFDFFSIKDYDSKYNLKINDPKTCYYLSATEDNKWYIFAAYFESKKMKKKYWNDYFLYKSNPDYIITAEKLSEIENIIKSNCRD